MGFHNYDSVIIGGNYKEAITYLRALKLIGSSTLIILTSSSLVGIHPTKVYLVGNYESRSDWKELKIILKAATYSETIWYIFHNLEEVDVKNCFTYDFGVFKGKEPTVEKSLTLTKEMEELLSKELDKMLLEVKKPLTAAEYNIWWQNEPSNFTMVYKSTTLNYHPLGISNPNFVLYSNKHWLKEIKVFLVGNMFVYGASCNRCGAWLKIEGPHPVSLMTNSTDEERKEFFQYGIKKLEEGICSA